MCVEIGNTLSVGRKIIASCRCRDGWPQLKHPNHHLGVISLVICHGTVVVTVQCSLASSAPVRYHNEYCSACLLLNTCRCFQVEAHLFIQQIFISRHWIQCISEENLKDFCFARDSVEKHISDGWAHSNAKCLLLPSSATIELIWGSICNHIMQSENLENVCPRLINTGLALVR